MQVKVNKFWLWYSRFIGHAEGTIDKDGTEYMNIGYVEFSLAILVVFVICIITIVKFKS